VTSISKQEIIELLGCEGNEQKELHKKAVAVRNEHASNSVYFRGLIEFSNICLNDCLYCGIRKSNYKVNRYEHSVSDILSAVELITGSGITSVVLQSGERNDKHFREYVCQILEAIKNKYPEILITLSVGEQEKEIYRKFRELGVERYLLRIETSNEYHYNLLHPNKMSFSNRTRCLNDLKELGYQVGSGVMINSPFQTIENLAEDILFLRSQDIDMCGMGPFIPHSDTPFADTPFYPETALNMGLKMISVLRLVMPDINIAATTALEALSSKGRELGLEAGANVIMPQFSPQESRKDYFLYDNKPVGFTDYQQLIETLTQMCIRCGMTPDFTNPGSSAHFQRRITNG